ncbi:MAG: transposase [Desulfovibrio sp.]|nr:transposase [Desulfovibrio sp.]
MTDETLEIDLGIKKLAVVSHKNGSVVKTHENINKTKRVRQLEKRLRREQRKLSRKLENNTKAKNSKGRPIWKRPLRECKNIQRQNNIIHLIYKNYLTFARIIFIRQLLRV